MDGWMDGSLRQLSFLSIFSFRVSAYAIYTVFQKHTWLRFR